MRAARWLLAAALLGGLAPAAAAHEVRPGYLELRQGEGETWSVLFKVPAKGDRRLGIYLALPGSCALEPAPARLAGGGYVERGTARCPDGLTGHAVSIAGLPETRTDVLARVQRADGATQTARLTPDSPSFEVVAAPGAWAVARAYAGLGVEHILLGVDHLLFVLALLFLVGGWGRLVATVSAFTAAHSLTLAAATLGWIRVPQAPVEAAVALSIVFVAVEVLQRGGGRAGLAEHRPWLVAFAFGLLHGLGFAAALRELGLPENAIPLALAAFNVGVELGQLAFVAAVFTGLGLVRSLASSEVSTWTMVGRLARPAAYGIGIVAACWLIDRTLRLWA